MFTGLVSGTGRFLSLDKSGDPVLKVSAEFSRKIHIGDSVSVNGSCLTVTKISGSEYSFNISSETLEKTNICDQSKGGMLNLELPLTLDDLVSGHLVSGHVDGTARVRSIAKMKGSTRITFGFTVPGWRRYIVEKGSIAVNGISLTVNEIKSSTFTAGILPLTFEKTNLYTLSPGQRVNIELDLVGKYLYNQKP